MIYKCKLKTRKEMERDISRKDLGWWHDVCPGKTLTLKEAQQKDLDRCIGTKDKNPSDYMVETFERGALVHKNAIKKMTKNKEG